MKNKLLLTLLISSSILQGSAVFANTNESTQPETHISSVNLIEDKDSLRTNKSRFIELEDAIKSVLQAENYVKTSTEPLNVDKSEFLNRVTIMVKGKDGNNYEKLNFDVLVKATDKVSAAQATAKFTFNIQDKLIENIRKDSKNTLSIDNQLYYRLNTGNSSEEIAFIDSKVTQDTEGNTATSVLTINANINRLVGTPIRPNEPDPVIKILGTPPTKPDKDSTKTQLPEGIDFLSIRENKQDESNYDYIIEGRVKDGYWGTQGNTGKFATIYINKPDGKVFGTVRVDKDGIFRSTIKSPEKYEMFNLEYAYEKGIYTIGYPVLPKLENEDPATKPSTEDPVTKPSTEDTTTETSTEGTATETSTEDTTTKPSTEDTTTKTSTEDTTTETSTEGATTETSTEGTTTKTSTEDTTTKTSTEDNTTKPSTEGTTTKTSTETKPVEKTEKSKAELPKTNESSSILLSILGLLGLSSVPGLIMIRNKK